MYKCDRATSHDLSHQMSRLGFEHNVLCDLLFNTWDVVSRPVPDDAAAWNRNRRAWRSGGFPSYYSRNIT